MICPLLTWNAVGTRAESTPGICPYWSSLSRASSCGVPAGASNTAVLSNSPAATPLREQVKASTAT